MEDTDYCLNSIGLDGQTSGVGIIAQGQDDDDMETGQLGNTKVSTMEPSPMDIEEIIALLYENSSMEGNVGYVENMDYFLNSFGLDDYWTTG